MLREVSELPGIKVFTAKVFPDERGFLLQSWVKHQLEELGIPGEFQQAIQTCSRRGAVRGLHFQWQPPMGKLVRCIRGRILDVVVDIRHNSPTLGDHAVLELTGANHTVIWVPPGFAHGTFALEEDSIVLYECTSEHHAGNEGGIRWNDPALGIHWPDIEPIVSEKDRAAPTLSQWLADPRSRHFTF